MLEGQHVIQPAGYERERRGSQKQLRGCGLEPLLGGGRQGGQSGEDASRARSWGPNQQVNLGSRQRGAL